MLVHLLVPINKRRNVCGVCVRACVGCVCVGAGVCARECLCVVCAWVCKCILVVCACVCECMHVGMHACAVCMCVMHIYKNKYLFANSLLCYWRLEGSWSAARDSGVNCFMLDALLETGWLVLQMVEERRTVRDSSGREETTVTRRMGDKSHTVSTIRDEQGHVVKKETFNNVDKGEITPLYPYDIGIFCTL